MKSAVIVACIVLLVIQSTLIDAGRSKDKRVATQQQIEAIQQILSREGLKKCQAFIGKHGKATTPIEKNCMKLENHEKILEANDCNQSVLQEISNVLECNKFGKKAKSLAQKDKTKVTPSATTVTKGVQTVTTTKGPQTGSNVTKAKA